MWRDAVDDERATSFDTGRGRARGWRGGSTTENSADYLIHARDRFFFFRTLGVATLPLDFLGFSRVQYHSGQIPDIVNPRGVYYFRARGDESAYPRVGFVRATTADMICR